MDLILLGLGGALGSITRYKLGAWVSRKRKTDFPLGIFLINITGALLLGLISGSGIKGNLYLLLADGFLGAYTTFSTFMVEGVFLLEENKKLNAIGYIIGTLLLGIVGFAAGWLLGRLFV